MAELTKIEWATHTFNPWEGCQNVGPGCDHCYAETRNARFGGGTAPNWGPGAPRRRTSASNWRKPLAWQADAARFFAANGHRQRVFCASLADVFDNAVDPAWRADLATLIYATPDLDWLLLTKRIGNVPDMLWAMFRGDIPANLRVGATIVNQEEWNRDAAKIAQVAVLIGKARIFLSMEPLLGPVDLEAVQSYRLQGIVGWVIVGGESGPGARPMNAAWAIALRDKCAAARVPYLFKQWGEWFRYGEIDADGNQNSRTKHERPGEWHEWGEGGGFSVRIGKREAGRFLEGVTHDGVPLE